MEIQGLLFVCSEEASHCRGFSCGALALGMWASVIVVAQKAQQLWLVGSRVQAQYVARGLSCPAACGIFQDPGLNQCPLLCKVDSTTAPQGSLMDDLMNQFFKKIFHYSV